MRTSRLVAFGVIVLAGAASAHWAYRNWYAIPIAAINKDIARFQREIEVCDTDAAIHPRVRRELEAIKIGMLGGDEQTVNARIRTAINQIFASLALSSASVEPRRMRAMPNPAAKSRLAAMRAGGRTPDFLVIPVAATTKCSYEQGVMLLTTILAQPWAHRVDQFSIRPIDSERKIFDVDVAFSTVFVPGVAGPSDNDQLWVEPDAAMRSRAATLIAHNHFITPAPPPPPPPPPQVDPVPEVKPEPEPPAPPPPPPPYGDWRITAVIQTPQTDELWLLNSSSGKRVVLTPGNTVLDAVFEGIDGEYARVRIGEEVFRVRLGQTLKDRTPENQ